MFKRIILIFLGFLFLSQLTYSQNDKIRSLLKQVAAGKIQEAKMQMVDLLADYPDDPGVQLLHGIVLDDAYKAVEIYEKIIKKYPNSEWADQAYWRLVQFYAILGNIDRANELLDSYRKNFPTSEFLITASDAVRFAQIASKGEVKNIKATKPKKNEEVIETKKEPEKPQKKTLVESQHQSQPKSQTEDSNDLDELKVYYGLQVGIYSNQEAARSEMERFIQQRLRAVLVNKKVDGNNMYAVVIGNYSTKEAAEQAKPLVSNTCGCNPIIVKK